MDDTGTKAVTSDLCARAMGPWSPWESPPRERPAAGFRSGYIPKESTACDCTVNHVAALAYGVIAEGRLGARLQTRWDVPARLPPRHRGRRLCVLVRGHVLNIPHAVDVRQKEGPEASDLIVAGSRSWARTTIHAFKGRCPTIRRSGRSSDAYAVRTARRQFGKLSTGSSQR